MAMIVFLVEILNLKSTEYGENMESNKTVRAVEWEEGGAVMITDAEKLRAGSLMAELFKN